MQYKMESYNCKETRSVVSFPLVKGNRNDVTLSDSKTAMEYEQREKDVGSTLPLLSKKYKDNVSVRNSLSLPRAKLGIIKNSIYRNRNNVIDNEEHKYISVENDNDDDNDETYKAAMELLHTYAYRRKILTAATQVAERMKDSANQIAEWAEESQIRSIAQPINGKGDNSDSLTNNNDTENNNAKNSRSSSIHTHEHDSDNKSETTTKRKNSQVAGEELHPNMNRTHGRHSIHDAVSSSYLDECAMDRITEQLMKDQSEENQAARGIALETRTDEENINCQVNDKVERLRRVRDLQRAIVELDDEIEEHRQELEQQQYEEERNQQSSQQQSFVSQRQMHHRNEHNSLQLKTQESNAESTRSEMKYLANGDSMPTVLTNNTENLPSDNDVNNNIEGKKNKEQISQSETSLQTWHNDNNNNVECVVESASQSSLLRRLIYSIDAKSRTLSEMKVQLRALLREDDHDDDMRPPSPPSTFSSNALATTLEYMSSSIHELVNSTDKVCVASVFKTRDEALSLAPLLHRMQQHDNYLLRCFDVAHSHATHFENGEKALVEGGTFEVNSLRDKFLLRKETLTAQEQREKIAEESSNNLRARLRHLRRRCDMWEELFFHRTPIFRESDEYVILDDDDEHDVDDDGGNNAHLYSSKAHNDDINTKSKIENTSNILVSEYRRNEKNARKHEKEECRHHSSIPHYKSKHVLNTSRVDECKNKASNNNSNLQLLPNQLKQEKFEKTESALQQECKKSDEVENIKFAATSPNAIWQVQKEERPLSSRQRSHVNEMSNTHAFMYSPQSTQPFRSPQVCLLSSEVEPSPLHQNNYYIRNVKNLDNFSNRNSDLLCVNDAMQAELEREVADEWGNPYVKYRTRSIATLSTKPSFRRQSFTVARSRHNTCASLVDDNRPSSKTSYLYENVNNNNNNNSNKERNELTHEAQCVTDNLNLNRNSALENPKFGGKAEREAEQFNEVNGTTISAAADAAVVVNSPFADHTMNKHTSNQDGIHSNYTKPPLPTPFSFDPLQHNTSHETHVYHTSSSNTNEEINVLSCAETDSVDDKGQIHNYDFQQNDRSFLFEISAETKVTAEARALSLLQNLLHTLPANNNPSNISSLKNTNVSNSSATNTQNEESVIDVSTQSIQTHTNNVDSRSKNNDNVRASVQRLIRYLLYSVKNN